MVAAGLDAFQKVQKIGLQVHFVVRRRDAVDAGSTVLAGQPVGLRHPIQIDDVVERAKRRPPFRPRQIGYPLSVRGQVCGVQCPLPCVRSTVLFSWRPPSLRRVPASPVPRPHQYYEGARAGSRSASPLSRSLALAPPWRRSLSTRSTPVTPPGTCRYAPSARRDALLTLSPALHPSPQVASPQCRAHHFRRRGNQIPIALAAHPAPKLPATSCLGAFWTPAARARGASRDPGVQKPAQERAYVRGRRCKPSGSRFVDAVSA